MRSSIHRSNSVKKTLVPEISGPACDVTCIHPEAVAEARAVSIDRATATELSQIFQVMADPTRLRIISLLAGRELCVCDLASALEMTQSAVSHQLRVMRITKLVKCRREGRVAWYSLDDDHVEKLFLQGVSHIGHVTGGEMETAGDIDPE
ncbi:MAG: metalloregulator ArsR/SmtB family transcription factor [Thermoleophilia bacterium]